MAGPALINEAISVNNGEMSLAAAKYGSERLAINNQSI